MLQTIEFSLNEFKLYKLVDGKRDCMQNTTKQATKNIKLFSLQTDSYKRLTTILYI